MSEYDDFEKPFLIVLDTKQEEKHLLNNNLNDHINTRRIPVKPYRQSSVLWDQVSRLHATRESQFHDYRLKFTQQPQHQRQVVVDAHQEKKKKKQAGDTPTVTGARLPTNKLRSIDFVRQKYGIPSRYLTSDSDAERRRRRVQMNPLTMNPLNFEQNDIGLLRTQLHHFLSMQTRGKLSDEMILRNELEIELFNNPGYASELLQQAKYTSASSNSSSRTTNELFESELQRLIKRGKQRYSDMIKTIQFISQYILSEKDLRTAYINSTSTTSKKKKKANQNVTKQREIVPIDYELKRKRLYNQMVMSVFDGKDRSLFDPFRIGIEPPLDPEAYDPLAFEFAVFNPPKSSRRDAKPNKIQNMHTLTRNARNEPIPLIPQRISSKMAFMNRSSY